MTANTPENADQPQDGPGTPQTPGYAAPTAPGYAPPPPPGYSTTPPPPAPDYGPPAGYAAPQGAYLPPAYGAAAPLSDSDQRLWAVLSHIGSLIFYFLAPLIVYLVFKGRGAFSDDQAKESLNFQITFAIASAALSIIGVITVGIGFLLFIPLGIAFVVFVIIASVQASQGVAYRYPVNIRFIK